MTLMCIDRSQSPTHKGSFLQGRKSPVSNNLNAKQHRRGSCSSPPLPSGKGQQQPPSGSSRYKTELCRPFEESGTCKYGDKCQFAHGARELRSMARHPKYKTELCRTFHSTGLCPYGPRCHFIHNKAQEQQQPPMLLRGSSTGDASPASSHSGTPTATRSFDDLYYSAAAQDLVNSLNQRFCCDAYDQSVFGDDNSPLLLDLLQTPSPLLTPTTPDHGFFRLPVFDLLHK